MRNTATQSWTEVMEAEELWDGEMTGVEVGSAKVLLVNADGEVRAYQNRCPHQAWRLDEGDFDGETITCVRHLWMFNATTGKGVNPRNTTLKSYPCVVNDDGMICVDVG